MMFETWKHVPKTEKRCCVFKNSHLLFGWNLLLKNLLTTLYGEILNKKEPITAIGFTLLYNKSFLFLL